MAVQAETIKSLLFADSIVQSVHSGTGAANVRLWHYDLYRYIFLTTI